MKKQRLLLFAITAILIVIAASFAVEKFRCPGEIWIDIGKFDSKDAGLRASIPRLAAEIERCPKAEIYRIVWVGPEPDPTVANVNRRSTFYYRPARQLGYEADVYSGPFGEDYRVDDAAIGAVAQQGGTLEDFKEYDQRRK